MLINSSEKHSVPQIHSKSTTNEFPELFYNTEEYQQLQNLPSPKVVSLFDDDSRQALGQIQFFQNGNQWVSGYNAPFGSFEFTQYIDRKSVRKFINDVIDQTDHFVIRHYPPIYDSHDMLQELLDIPNLRVIEDINHHIDLHSFSQSNLHNMQQRRINKCKQLGIKIKKVTGVRDLDNIYQFIADCRKEQQLEINISYSKFKAGFEQTNRYEAFAAYHESELVACCVLVRVNHNVIYNYLPASSKKSHRYSPMSYLMIHVIKHYQALGYQYLDWGISSVEGTEQVSLAQYKERMGAKRTAKYTFIR